MYAHRTHPSPDTKLESVASHHVTSRSQRPHSCHRTQPAPAHGSQPAAYPDLHISPPSLANPRLVTPDTWPSIAYIPPLTGHLGYQIRPAHGAARGQEQQEQQQERP